MALSPERMLRECVVEPPIEPDGDPETLADETLDLRPDNFQFKESSIATYAKSIPEKRAFPLPFATSYTAGKVAQALLDAIWMAGHFRLGDLTLKADTTWTCKQLGDAAAVYHSGESTCNSLDALGVKIDKYSLCSGQPSVNFKAFTVAEEDAPEEEEVTLLRELPFRTANPRISRRRKASATFLPEKSDWLLFIPFDPCDFRLGGSALTQAVGVQAGTAPDISDADYFIDCYEVVRELVEDGVVKAGATVGDGGLMTCLRKLSVGGTGADVSIRNVCKAYGEDSQVRVLFSEVPGVVLQIADIDYDYVDAELILQDVVYFPLGHPVPGRSSVRLTEAVEIPQILESLLNTLEGED